MDADDDYKWKTRTTGGVKRQKSRHFVSRKLDARQYAICAGACFLISWGLAVTFLLLRLGIMYTFDTIALTRKHYVVEGATSWAKTVASKDVMQAVNVWNLINSSIIGLVYKEPQDYSNLNSVLSPAFETMPSLHSVDLTFSDSVSEVNMVRQNGSDVVTSSNYMRSNSVDCFLMGVDSCTAIEDLLPGQVAPLRPQWQILGTLLKPSAYGGVFTWAPEPELVVEPSGDGGSLLSPSIRLIFQSTFPRHRTPSGASTKVIGRITVKVAALGGERLVDSRLGEKGSIYLCDASGTMLASRNPSDLLTVEDGLVRYRYLWEIDGDGVSTVRNAFAGSSIEAMTVKSGDTLVAVEPLDHPLERFAIVAVAPSFEPFENHVLIGTSAIASIVAPAPYVLAGGMAFIFFWAQCFHTLRKSEKKGPEGRVSITASHISRTSISSNLSDGAPGGIFRSMTYRARKLPSFMRSKTVLR